MKKNLFELLRVRRGLKKAFSLTETIIALLILSIAILAIALVPIMSTKMVLQATRREQATFLAVNMLDFLESYSYNVSINSQDVVGDFSRRYQKPAFNTASSDLHIATVTISWQGISGPSTLTLERPLSQFASETRKE